MIRRLDRMQDLGPRDGVGLVEDRRDIVGVAVVIVAAPRLVRPAEAAAVVGDDAVSGGEGSAAQRLAGGLVRGQHPAVQVADDHAVVQALQDRVDLAGLDPLLIASQAVAVRDAAGLYRGLIDLKASIDHNTRVTAEIGIIMLEMLRLQSVATVGAGQAGVIDAATIAAEREYVDFTLPDMN